MALYIPEKSTSGSAQVAPNFAGASEQSKSFKNGKHVTQKSDPSETRLKHHSTSAHEVSPLRIRDTLQDSIKIPRFGISKDKLYCTVDCVKGLKVQALFFIIVLKFGDRFFVSEFSPFPPPSSSRRAPKSGKNTSSSTSIAIRKMSPYSKEPDYESTISDMEHSDTYLSDASSEISPAIHSPSPPHQPNPQLDQKSLYNPYSEPNTPVIEEMDRSICDKFNLFIGNLDPSCPNLCSKIVEAMYNLSNFLLNYTPLPSQVMLDRLAGWFLSPVCFPQIYGLENLISDILTCPYFVGFMPDEISNEVMFTHMYQKPAHGYFIIKFGTAVQSLTLYAHHQSGDGRNNVFSALIRYQLLPDRKNIVLWVDTDDDRAESQRNSLSEVLAYVSKRTSWIPLSREDFMAHTNTYKTHYTTSYASKSSTYQDVYYDTAGNKPVCRFDSGYSNHDHDQAIPIDTFSYLPQ